MLARRLRDDAPRWRASTASRAHECPLAERTTAASRSCESGGGHAATAIGPDSAICADCLAELFDPGRPPLPLRVHQLHELRTALHDHARAPLRPGDDQHGGASRSARHAPPSTAPPRDRRFHAEPNACPACGPRLALRRCGGAPIDGVDPIAADRCGGSRAARSSRSRGWAASISRATRATPTRSRGCASARRARKSRSR